MNKNKKHYHMVGICGISMQGIAQILQANGHKVTGSDLRKCDIKNLSNSKH